MSTTIVYNAVSASETVRGVERYHLGVLPALAALDSGWRIVVLRAPWQTYYAPLDRCTGLELETVEPVRSRAGRGLWQLLDGGVRRRRLDLLHLGNVIPAPVGVTAPIVAMVHDVIEFRAPRAYGRVRRWARQRLVRRLARRARKFVTVDDTTARELEGLVGLAHGQVQAIGMGIHPLPALDPRPAAERDHAIVFVGGLDHHKRLDLVVAAMTRVANVQLRIISAGGPAEPSLRRLAEQLGVANRIDWRGRLTDAEARAVVSRSAALVLPSDMEGFGIPVIEAFQVGTPAILSTGVPLATEWGQLRGPVFRAGDAVALASTMERFLDDVEERERLARLGPALAAQFTWPEVAARLRAVWLEVLGCDVVARPLPAETQRLV